MSNQLHVTDDALELYSLGRLNEPEAEELEEHLLICEDCQERLQREDASVKAMRKALGGKPDVRDGRSRNLLPFTSRWPSVALLSAAAFAAVLLMTFAAPQSRPQPQELQLVAQRGSHDLTIRARSGSPLRLRVNTTELEPLTVYRVELVSAGGEVMWNQKAPAAGNLLVADVDRDLEPGQYWLRIYHPERSAEALREFGLTVE